MSRLSFGEWGGKSVVWTRHGNVVGFRHIHLHFFVAIFAKTIHHIHLHASQVLPTGTGDILCYCTLTLTLKLKSIFQAQQISKKSFQSPDEGLELTEIVSTYYQ